MTDERAVSTVVSYVLTIGISALLVVGLLVATSGYVDTQRQETIRDELQVLGHQLASDISAADRLVASDGETVEIRRDFPTAVTGIPFHIEFEGSGPITTLVLSTSNPNIVVEVDVRTETDLTATDVIDGGSVVIEYDSGADKLEVSDA